MVQTGREQFAWPKGPAVAALKKSCYGMAGNMRDIFNNSDGKLLTRLCYNRLI